MAPVEEMSPEGDQLNLADSLFNSVYLRMGWVPLDVVCQGIVASQETPPSQEEVLAVLESMKDHIRIRHYNGTLWVTTFPGRDVVCHPLRRMEDSDKSESSEESECHNDTQDDVQDDTQDGTQDGTQDDTQDGTQDGTRDGTRDGDTFRWKDVEIYNVRAAEKAGEGCLGDDFKADTVAEMLWRTSASNHQITEWI